MGQQREAELSANQITQARADALCVLRRKYVTSLLLVFLELLRQDDVGGMVR